MAVRRLLLVRARREREADELEQDPLDRRLIARRGRHGDGRTAPGADRLDPGATEQACLVGGETNPAVDDLNRGRRTAQEQGPYIARGDPELVGPLAHDRVAPPAVGHVLVREPLFGRRQMPLEQGLDHGFEVIEQASGVEHRTIVPSLPTSR